MSSITYKRVPELLEKIEQSLKVAVKDARELTKLSTDQKAPKELDKISFDLFKDNRKNETVDKVNRFIEVIEGLNNYITKYEKENKKFLDLKATLNDKLKELRLLVGNETLAVKKAEEGCADKISKRLNTRTSTIYAVAVSVLTATAFTLGYLAK